MDLDRLAQATRALVGTGLIEYALVAPFDTGVPDGLLVVARGRPGSVTLAVEVVLRRVLAAQWPSYVLLHTHATGSSPSGDDLAVTRRLVAASRACGLRLAAHLVVGPSDWSDCLPDAQLPSAA